MFDSANNENKSDDLDSPLCISIEFLTRKRSIGGGDGSDPGFRSIPNPPPTQTPMPSGCHQPDLPSLLYTYDFFSYRYATGSDLFNSASSSIEGRSILHFIIGATSSLSKVGCGLMPSHRLKVGCRQLTHSLSSDAMCTITLKVRT
ncbi:hypothetical protein L2E82_03923 [Cichorium intybus]|uniref:Uncharacterized protein n=1 Tax=Cichorium intybus TaxID=13427 RepID=A0ACB9H6U9_CICIN|nr:hypothetical protein L2E82_03923 [Cichorium intybus]